ncbi:MAG: hypothetical protein Q9195_006582 [Heterodermia aff. obscurata]
MALNQAQDAERANSPNLAIDLPSNNPFRNRATSPLSANSLPSPQSPSFNLQTAPPERPRSRNPFLDQTDTEPSNLADAQQPSGSSHRVMAAPASPKRGQLYGNTAELFNNLALDDRPLNTDTGIADPTAYAQRPSRPENVPPVRRFGPSSHQVSRSQEEEQQRLRNGGKPRGPQALDIFADPTDTSRPLRPRRNSESSLVDKNGRMSSDDEKRRRERRHRDREARHRDGRPRAPGSSTTKKPSRKLDIIDQLDVTSIYGTGLVHHDGPFDACNPHRNRKGSQRAPMQAFAKDSANNALGGSGPVNKNIDLAQFHGRGDEGFTDYSKSGVNSSVIDTSEPYAGSSTAGRFGREVRPGADRAMNFNATDRVEPVHGDESLGLGTSTFLDGAPAPRAAIQRRESESDNGGLGNSGGLGRKKSLVQKIRGINRSDRTATAPMRSPDFERGPPSPTSPRKLPMSGGGMPRVKETNQNPFFNDYDEQYEKKGARIQIAEEQNKIEHGGSARARAASGSTRGPPPAMLERRVTHDGSAGSEEAKTGGGGFLSRVKSLKGGRRAR